MTKKTIEPNIVIGPDTIEKLPELLKSCGHKALVIHGHRPVEDGLLVKVRLLLNKAGFPYANMGQILPNPKYSSVRRGIKIAREEHCDVILSLGGSSTLQCAKAIALGLPYKGDVWDFWTGKSKPKQVAPIAAVLTNPATGAEIGHSCTVVRKGERKTIRMEQLACTFAVLDPCLSMYPEYPTINQIFVLFADLFHGMLAADEKDTGVYQALIRHLLDAADALKADIHDIQARTSLFEVGYHAHKDLTLPKFALEKVTDELAFEYSLPDGSALSAVFLSWLESLDEADQKKVMKTAADLCSQAFNSYTEACHGIYGLLKVLDMPLSIPAAGLLISDKKLLKLTDDKTLQKILKHANRPVRFDEPAEEAES